MGSLWQVDQFLAKPQVERPILAYQSAGDPEAVRELPRWLVHLDQGVLEQVELAGKLERARVLDLLWMIEN